MVGFAEVEYTCEAVCRPKDPTRVSACGVDSILCWASSRFSMGESEPARAFLFETTRGDGGADDSTGVSASRVASMPLGWLATPKLVCDAESGETRKVLCGKMCDSIGGLEEPVASSRLGSASTRGAAEGEFGGVATQVPAGSGERAKFEKPIALGEPSRAATTREGMPSATSRMEVAAGRIQNCPCPG